MIEYRSTEALKKRLRAYYKRTWNYEDIPIEIKQHEKDKIVTNIVSWEDEFFIALENINSETLLIISNKRTIFINNEVQVKCWFSFEEIIGIGLNKDFKLMKQDCPVNLFFKDKSIYKFVVYNLEQAVKIRNDLFAIINNSIVRWEGSNFRLTHPLN